MEKVQNTSRGMNSSKSTLFMPWNGLTHSHFFLKTWGFEFTVLDGFSWVFVCFWFVGSVYELLVEEWWRNEDFGIFHENGDFVLSKFRPPLLSFCLVPIVGVTWSPSVKN